MINTDAFTKRLQKVIDYHGESASSFAEKIGVQRSSISHILSGRNKPSLDFVMKILSRFPDVELYWLLNGKGQFPSQVEKPKTENLKPQVENQNLFSQPEISEMPKITKTQNSSNSPIERIVIFYKDGSFKNFEN